MDKVEQELGEKQGWFHPYKHLPQEVTQSLPEAVAHSQETVQTEHESTAQIDIRQPIGPRIETRQIPSYPDPILRLPPKPPDLKEKGEIYQIWTWTET